MYQHCLYCDHPLSRTGGLDSVRSGVRFAFDPKRERVWTICDRCHGWNLWWKDERADALARLERRAHDRGRVLLETDHVALLTVDGRQMVRVGPAPRREEAWWRYGRQLRERRARFRSPLTTVGAATYSAVSSVGRSIGISPVTGDFRGTTNLRVDVLRWRRFGGTAWYGRAPCPSCNSVLIRLFFFKSSDLLLLPGSDGVPAIGLPCTRCDPWTFEKTYAFDALVVEPVLRRVLAWHNVSGATRAELTYAVRLIEEAGSARRFARQLAETRQPIHAMGRIQRLALEISVNEGAERRRLAGLVAGLDARWRRAEELAAIMDEEL